MSFYRSLLAAAAAMALAMPAFADEAPATADQATQSAAPSSEQTVPQAKVDINKASVKDLVKVKGISVAQAKAIVAYRKKNGDFKTLEDLKNVKGFKKMNADKMKDIQDQLTAG